jgi:hypothetical protein
VGVGFGRDNGVPAEADPANKTNVKATLLSIFMTFALMARSSREPKFIFDRHHVRRAAGAKAWKASPRIRIKLTAVVLLPDGTVVEPMVNA